MCSSVLFIVAILHHNISSVNQTKFFGVISDVTNNEISYLEGDGSDVLNTDDYDVWSLGTGITFIVEDNNLVLVTS